MLPDFQDIPPLYFWVAGFVLAAAVIRRIPVLRTIASFAMWGALIVLLVGVFDQRVRFDPYLERITAMLKLDRQEVVGEELRIRMSADGHFWAKARIDGVERRLLVDSGATVTALSTGTAAAARIAVRDAVFPVILRTANGTIRAQTAIVRDLRLGNIVARDLAVVVSAGLGDTDILGMNFLSRLKTWRVEGRTLILVPHHPQTPAGPASAPGA